jgi:glucose/arabinose dehydrogenase
MAGAIAMIVVTMFIMFASESTIAHEQKKIGPLLLDPALTAAVVAEGLNSPTSMTFLDSDTILVLQKNDGQIRLISGGRLHNEPVLEIDVVNEAERGLLGIAIGNDVENHTSVFLYLTEKDGDNIRNRVYKYSYDSSSNALSNVTLILDLPGDPGPFHNGGKIAIGPRDGHLYAVIGDVNAGGGMLDNEIQGRDPDDKSVVLRVNRETGLPVTDNPFYSYSGEMEKLRKYYAYGIRNSFGMDFDPVTGKLWITENGPDKYDEINIVEPGFNSGWHKIIGPISRSNLTLEDNDLISFNGSKYVDPVFSWYAPIGITDIEFFNSATLGEKYENDVFVGDINNGNLYFFTVNKERNGFELDNELSDLVADPVGDDILGEVSRIMIGENFGRITDIETGPDGHLYVLSYEGGKIYRITREA